MRSIYETQKPNKKHKYNLNAFGDDVQLYASMRKHRQR